MHMSTVIKMFALFYVLFAKKDGFHWVYNLYVGKTLGEIETHFVKLVEFLKQQNERVFHKQVVPKLEVFMKVISNKLSSIQQQLDSR